MLRSLTGSGRERDIDDQLKQAGAPDELRAEITANFRELRASLRDAQMAFQAVLDAKADESTKHAVDVRRLAETELERERARGWATLWCVVALTAILTLLGVHVSSEPWWPV